MRDLPADGPGSGTAQDFTGLGLSMWGKKKGETEREENLDTPSKRKEPPHRLSPTQASAGSPRRVKKVGEKREKQSEKEERR